MFGTFSDKCSGRTRKGNRSKMKAGADFLASVRFWCIPFEEVETQIRSNFVKMQISSNFRSDKFFEILESFAQGLDFSQNVQNAVLSVSLLRSTSQVHRQGYRSWAPYRPRSVKLYYKSLVLGSVKLNYRSLYYKSPALGWVQLYYNSLEQGSVKLNNNSLVQVSKTELQKPVLQKPSTGVSTTALQ